MRDVKTSYRAYQDEASFHSQAQNDVAFSANEGLGIGIGSQFANTPLVQYHDSSGEGDGLGITIFEPRAPKPGVPRRLGLGSVSAPQTPTTKGDEWRNRRASVVAGLSGLKEEVKVESGGAFVNGSRKENGNGVGMERSGSGGVMVGGGFVEFGDV